MSFLSLWAPLHGKNYRELSVRNPWARPQKYQQPPQKYQQRPWNSREKTVKNTPFWLQCCFQLKHPVQTMDDVMAMMEAGKAIREKMHVFDA